MRRGGNRRGGVRGGGGGPAPMVGIGNLNTSNYFGTAAGGGTAGVDTGFFVAYLCRIITVANTQFWSYRSGGADGWQLRQMAATTLQFRAWDGSAVSRVSPALTLTGLEGKVVAVMGLHTGSALRLYANRAQVGTETTLTGYTLPSGSTAHAIAQQFASGCEFYGMVSGNGVPSLANFQSWCDAVKVARGVVDMVGVAGEHMWRPGAGNLSDLIGSSTMTKTGTGHTYVANRSPQWAW